MVQERTQMKTVAARRGKFRRLEVLQEVCRHTPPHLTVEHLHFFDHPLDRLAGAGHLVVELRGSIRRGGRAGEAILERFLHNLACAYPHGGMTLVHKIRPVHAHRLAFEVSAIL